MLTCRLRPVHRWCFLVVVDLRRCEWGWLWLRVVTGVMGRATRALLCVTTVVVWGPALSSLESQAASVELSAAAMQSAATV